MEYLKHTYSSIPILIIIFVLAYLLLTQSGQKRENFDLGVDMRHFSRIGKFHDDYFIGSLPVRDLNDCKAVCNNMESCEGISYKDQPFPPDCRLYNDTATMLPDIRYLSWRNFWNKLY